MTIYKNPYVSRDCYFVKTANVGARKMEADRSTGYQIFFSENNWKIEKASYYNSSLKTFPVVAKTPQSIETLINTFVMETVLQAVDKQSREASHGISEKIHETRN